MKTNKLTKNQRQIIMLFLIGSMMGLIIFLFGLEGKNIFDKEIFLYEDLPMSSLGYIFFIKFFTFSLYYLFFEEKDWNFMGYLFLIILISITFYPLLWIFNLGAFFSIFTTMNAICVYFLLSNRISFLIKKIKS